MPGPTPKDHPKYTRVANELRAKIRGGELRPGDRLPSYAEMKARGVSQPTLDRVHVVLERDGLIEKRHGSGVFVANARAAKRPARSRRTPTGILGCVGLSSNSEPHPYFARVLAGAQDAAHRAGRDLLLFRESGEVHWDLLDGLLIFGYGGREAMMTRPEPMPCTAVLVRGFHVPHVDTDDFAALRTLTGHLLERGHRRIAYLASSLDYESSQRLQGYRATLMDAGIGAEASWVRAFTNETFDPKIGFTGYGERALQRWLGEDWRELGCTALLCHNDEVAAGALRALHGAGIRVPQDVAVAGFDGLQLAEHLNPPLTTMEAPLYRIGARGTERLLRQMDEGSMSDDTVEELLPAGLLVRASTELERANR